MVRMRFTGSIPVVGSIFPWAPGEQVVERRKVLGKGPPNSRSVEEDGDGEEKV